MTHLVIANIHYIILFPDIAGSTDIPISKCLHGPLQDSPCLLAKVEDASQDRCFGDLSILTCRIKVYGISKAPLHLHLGGISLQGGHTQYNLRNACRAITSALKITCN